MFHKSTSYHKYIEVIWQIGHLYLLEYKISLEKYDTIHITALYITYILHSILNYSVYPGVYIK